jgi:hypothetical protein
LTISGVPFDRRASGRALAAGDDRTAATAAAERVEAPAAGAGGETRRPRQAQLLHRGLVDLRERAVALAGVVAGIAGPLLAERLQQRGRRQVAREAGLAGGHRAGERQSEDRNEARAAHLRVAR